MRLKGHRMLQGRPLIAPENKSRQGQTERSATDLLMASSMEAIADAAKSCGREGGKTSPPRTNACLL
jgi:hypothetical protein